MRTILATVGYTPEKVTHSLPLEGPVGEIVAFFGSKANRGTTAALKTIRAACRSVGVAVAEVEIGSAYDFAGAVEAYRGEIPARRGGDLLFNLSGGTGVMQAAAAFVCFTEGIPFSYYNREERRYVRSEALRLEPAGGISPQQRRVLDLLRQEPAGMRAADIARRLRLAPSTVDHHLKRLRGRRLVREKANDKTRRPLVVTTDLARLLMSEDKSHRAG